MKAFTVITTASGHEIFPFFTVKERTKGIGWFLDFGCFLEMNVPLGDRDLSKLLVKNGEQIPCPQRNRREWTAKVRDEDEPQICECGQKYTPWQKYTIGFECFHPDAGTVTRQDLVVKDAFCLRLHDKNTNDYNGKCLLIAPNKEQTEALVYWKLEGHKIIGEKDKRVIHQSSFLGDHHYLIAVRPSSNVIACKDVDKPATYALELCFDGKNVTLKKNILVEEQKKAVNS
jgi:hypothetical protein